MSQPTTTDRDEVLKRYLQTQSIADRNAVAEANIPLLITVAHRYLRRFEPGTGPTPAQLLSAAAVDYIRAIELHDPANGYTLSTYIWSAIYYAMTRWERQFYGSKRGPSGISLEGLKADSKFEPAAREADRRLSAEQLHAFFDGLRRYLTPREHQVIVGIYADGLDQQEIVVQIGLTKQRVSQLHQAAITKLRLLSFDDVARDIELCRDGIRGEKPYRQVKS